MSKRGVRALARAEGSVGEPQSSSRPSGMDSSLSAMHVLHLLLIRACWQMPPPPHSLHSLLLRACWQMLAPPHSLHSLLLRACWQMLDPPHSLHLFLCRACWQMLAPPHSLHWLLGLRVVYLEYILVVPTTVHPYGWSGLSLAP